MTLHFTAPHKDALDDKVEAHRFAVRHLRLVKVSAGKKNGVWTADMEIALS